MLVFTIFPQGSDMEADNDDLPDIDESLYRLPDDSDLYVHLEDVLPSGKDVNVFHNFCIQFYLTGTLICFFSFSLSWYAANIKDHFVHVPNRWETTLHCSIVSHWLGTYTK